LPNVIEHYAFISKLTVTNAIKITVDNISQLCFHVCVTVS